VGEGSATVSVVRMGSAPPTRQVDLLAVEEPLEIRLGWRAPHGLTRSEKTISITMRTPGHDLELAAGFLLGEGIVRDRAQIASLAHCGPVAPPRWAMPIVRLTS
jgi:FdhD protein